MSLLAYQQMKPSGIEYVGDIPNDWSSKRLGDLVSFAQGKAHEPYIDDDGDYICVNSRFVSTSGQTIKTCSVNLTPASLNDILMVMSDLPNGRALARAYYVGDHGKYAVNQRVCRITAERAHPRFLFYLLDRHPGLMQNDDGVHQTHLSNADFQKLKLCLPSASEQSQIARFLDHETARIDALIEEQQRLIALLKEKRQAVISHAVTKGLDPTVPMKDSGVEWLGEVPAHWEVKKLKHFGRVTGGFAFKSTEFTSEGHPVLKISNIGHLCFEWGDQSYLPHEFRESHSEFIAPKGALFFAMTRPVIAGGIKVARLEDDSLPLVNQRVGFMVIHDLDLSRYVLLSTQSDPFLCQFKNNLTITNQPNISSEGIESISITVPPLMEIKDILAFCLKVDAEVHSLIGDALRGTELLQERRSALISAAVTGKIDVSGWQPPASAPTPELAQEAV